MNNPTAPRFTLRTINSLIGSNAIGLELVKGDGYFYFVPRDPNVFIDSGSVMVYRLNDISAARWLDEAREAWATRQAGE